MIDQAPYLPIVSFEGRRVVLTFRIMPSEHGLKMILEDAERAIAWVNEQTGSSLVVEYRLPVAATAPS